MARVLPGTTPERTNRALFIAAVLFAGLAALLVFVALQSSDGNGGGTAAPVALDAVVATRDIPANTQVTLDMIEVRALPEGSVLEGTYGDVAAVAGLATRVPVEAGEQITIRKVGAGAVEDIEDVSLVLPPGRRGFAVEVTEVTSVGGLLLAGNFVDVIAVFDDGALNSQAQIVAGGVPQIGAVTLLQDVEVIAVAQEAQEPVPAASSAEQPDASGLTGQRPDDAERQPEARSVTLSVSADEAQLLALVQERGGAIWLSLRGAGDHERTPVAPIELLRLLEQSQSVVP